MANYINVNDVHVSSERQRKLFDPDALLELSDSIQNRAIGLLHPIVLRRNDNGGYTLVAGERRLRAFVDSHELGVFTYHAGEQVPEGCIPYLDIGEMDPLDAWEAELEENIKRENLTWQERANATAQLMELRKAQAKAKGLPQPTVTQIAEEVRGASTGSYHTDTRNEIILAKHVDDPDVAKAKSPGEAIKVLRRKEEKARHEKLAEQVGKVQQSNRHQTHMMDARAFLEEARPETWDVIITDPPYGMGADEFGDSGGKAAGAHGYVDSEANFLEIMEWLPEELFRVAKPQAHLYLFCDMDWYHTLQNYFSNAGWRVFRTPMIWHKPTGFRTPWVDMGPQRRYETILYAVKGDKKTQKLGGDVITCPPDDNMGHMAQKPVGLYVDLLSRSIIPGDQVLDPFAGSGPLVNAANALLCHATLVEKDPAAYGMILSRIKALKETT